jgi:uncharacterized protein
MPSIARYFRAHLGDAEAQLLVATEFWRDQHVGDNRARALYWARRAAKNGAVRADELLGLITIDAGSPEPSSREIYAFSKSAAAAGDAPGQYMLGRCYEMGVGVPVDLEKALHWYTTAAANGDVEAEKCVARLCASDGS